MASIKQRANNDGTTSYTVLWRAGGARGGKQESEVFQDSTGAERFQNLVNGHGQRWPPGWVRGRGFVEDVREPGELFEPFALRASLHRSAHRHPRRHQGRNTAP
jgi:hypothetical protein